MTRSSRFEWPGRAGQSKVVSSRTPRRRRPHGSCGALKAAGSGVPAGIRTRAARATTLDCAHTSAYNEVFKGVDFLPEFSVFHS